MDTITKFQDLYIYMSCKYLSDYCNLLLYFTSNISYIESYLNSGIRKTHVNQYTTEIKYQT